MLPSFVHLRIHTEYSIRDGLVTIPKLMDSAVKFGIPALAITDLGNLYAIVKFYQAAHQAGIKPIIGVDLQIMDENNTSSLLTLLCQNNQGYLNLLSLVSKGFLQGQHEGIPFIQKDWIAPLSDGLIALSGGLDGDIGQAILEQDQKLALKNIIFWQKVFPQRFYLEISRVGKVKEEVYIEKILPLAERFALPVVATNDVRFLKRNDFDAHEARICIQSGVTLNDPNRQRFYTEQQYLRTPAEMQQLFADIPVAIKNTIEIAKRCNLAFKLGENRLPHFTVPEGHDTASYLSHVAQLGLQQRLEQLFRNPDEKKRLEPTYQERLTRELQVINKMGFAGYFLIVADFTKWAKENGIPVGPGRGSGPGSLVAYALHITDLDPISLELLFERFLNPERVSMPDFDIDFCMEGRDKVIAYVMNKHGQESVAHIITYGTMAAKAVVRDVGRVLGLGYGFVDKIAKLIPFELGMTLEKALAQEPLLRERYENEDDVRTLIDLAKKLEGIVRNVGKHAGGIVIAPGKLLEFVPLYCEQNEASHPVTQFDKDDVETVGLVKFDFLGLKTLTIIDKAIRIINQSAETQGKPAVDINLIPLNDGKTYSLLKECKTIAVFQLESHGMRDLIKRLQPDCFEDLIALVALFRPGPLQAGMVDDFINRKHGRAKVIYPHPNLEPILRSTYGAIVYQEQVMKIAQVLAGYTLGSADILRKAMGKKKPEEMAKQRKIFVGGAVDRGVYAEVATHIFDLMEKFAGYGFNKSHSASYALIAYQTAWLKAHHPAAFMAAVLSSEMDRTEKIIMLLAECKALHLKVTSPDINQSEYFFKVCDDQRILYGLGAIKGVGAAAIENIIAARTQDGPFQDLFDFCQRIDLRKINRRALEAFIKSGSFDCFKKSRAVLMANLNLALQDAEQQNLNKTFGQQDLLSIETAKPEHLYTEAPPWQDEVRLAYEKESLGFYLSGHPLNQYRNELSHFTSGSIDVLVQGPGARIAGIVTNLRTRQTKRGDRIGIFTLDDGTGQIETVCFSDVFHLNRSILAEDQLVIIEGDIAIDEFNNSMRLSAKNIYTLDQMREKFAQFLHITITPECEFSSNVLKDFLTPHLGGHCQIVFRYIRNDILAEVKLSPKWAIKPHKDLLLALEQQLMVKSAELKY